MRKVRRARISLARAIRIADRRATGRLDEAEIDREDGRLVWELQFERGDLETDVTVHARSGRVLEVDRDD